MKQFIQMLFKTTASFGGILAIIVVVVWGSTFLVVFLKNWSDRLPSEAAVWFADMNKARPKAAASDNGFVYAMGFMAAKGEDVEKWGARRIAALHAQGNDYRDLEWEEPLGMVFKLVDLTSFAVTTQILAQEIPQNFSEANDCWQVGQGRTDTELATERELLAWLEKDRWLLDRYLSLLTRSEWHETTPFAGSSFPLDAQGLLQGQKILMIQAWILAGLEDVESVRELLEDDITFWRGVMAGSDSLFTKMLSVRALENHFAWANLALRRLAEDRIMQAMPQSWWIPLSNSERSLARAMLGEWLLVDHHLRQLHAQRSTGEMVRLLFARINLGRALFFPLVHIHPQDTSNLFANTYKEMLQTLDGVPLDMLPQAISTAEDIFRKAVNAANIIDHPSWIIYNPLGKMFFAIGAYNFTRHVSAGADMEGLRQAALLATALRSQSVLPEHISRHLDHPSLRNPYDNEPFSWDGEMGAIVFQGLAREEKKYELLY